MYIYIYICIYIYTHSQTLFRCLRVKMYASIHTRTVCIVGICVHLLNLRLRKLGTRIGGCDRRNQLWRRAPVVNTCTPTPAETPTVQLAPTYPQPPAIIPTHIHTWWHYWKGRCESSWRVSVESGQELKV